MDKRLPIILPILATFLMLPRVNANAQGHWERMSEFPGAGSVSQIFCLNSDTIYVSGNGVRSVDGGISWQKIVGLYTNRVRFLDMNIGWNSYCDKTTDGGRTWTPHVNGIPTIVPNRTVGIEIYDCAFYNHNLGWAVGNFEGIYKTTNGGDTWITSHIIWDDGGGHDFYWYRLEMIAIIDSTHMVAVGGNQVRIMLGTSDGGTTWYGDSCIPQTSGYTDHVMFSDKRHGLSLEWYRYWATSNGGVDWSVPDTFSYDGPQHFADLSYPDSFHAWISGYTYSANTWRGMIASTSDAGTTWEFYYPPGPNTMVVDAITFVTKDLGYAWAHDTSGAVLLKYTSGNSSVKDHGGNVAADIQLHCRPNPVNSFSSIDFSFPRSQFVSLKLYNSIGAEIATLFKGEQSSGSHSVAFSSEALKSGIYWCRLTAGTSMIAEKLTVLH